MKLQKFKLKEKILNKRKILVWLGYGALIVFTIWLVTDLVMDYYSHIGVDEPLFP